MDTAMTRIIKANIALMQDPRTLAYSGLLMVGKNSISDDPEVTAQTNGRDVKYGRSFLESLTDAEVRALVLHETKHKMYQHLVIWPHLYKEDGIRANQACDYVINLEISDLDPTRQFLSLPSGGCIDPKYRGMDTFQVYKQLPKGGDGSGSLDQHDWEGAQELSDEDKQALQQAVESAIRTGAMLASKSGVTIDRSFEELMAPSVDWEYQLQEFVMDQCVGKGDSSWRRPSRRWLSQGVYMPSSVQESIEAVVVAIDTSGSIDDGMLRRAVSEVVGVCTAAAVQSLHVIYWDHTIQAHEVYALEDLDSVAQSTKPKGGGGTEFRSVIDYLEELKLVPDVAIVITDMEFSMPSQVPKYPVVWAATQPFQGTVPFGKLITIK